MFIQATFHGNRERKLFVLAVHILLSRDPDTP